MDDVRDVINVSSAGVPNTKVLKMIKRAEVTLAKQTLTPDENEKEARFNLFWRKETCSRDGVFLTC